MAETGLHAKMNYQLLGNSVPHLHAHIVPRPLLDPLPHRPLPWSYLDEGRQDEHVVAGYATRLAAELGQRWRRRSGSTAPISQSTGKMMPIRPRIQCPLRNVMTPKVHNSTR